MRAVLENERLLHGRSECCISDATKGTVILSGIGFAKTSQGSLAHLTQLDVVGSFDRQRGVSSAQDASCCTGASASSAGAFSIRGVEVHRCSRAQCLPCRNHSRQRGGQRRRLAKNVSSPTHPQAHNIDTHLPRIPIQPDLPARLSCSRPKLASARPKLTSTYRARLRRAACAAATGLLQPRIAHHDCAAAPRRLLWPVPLSLKTVRCTAAAGRGPRCVFALQIQSQGDACTGPLLSIVDAHKARMPSRDFFVFLLSCPLQVFSPHGRAGCVRAWS